MQIRRLKYVDHWVMVTTLGRPYLSTIQNTQWAATLNCHAVNDWTLRLTKSSRLTSSGPLSFVRLYVGLKSSSPPPFRPGPSTY